MTCGEFWSPSPVTEVVFKRPESGLRVPPWSRHGCQVETGRLIYSKIFCRSPLKTKIRGILESNFRTRKFLEEISSRFKWRNSRRTRWSPEKNLNRLPTSKKESSHWRYNESFSFNLIYILTDLALGRNISRVEEVPFVTNRDETSTIFRRGRKNLNKQ